jgi:hypothetical protein
MTNDALIATIAIDEWLALQARIRELEAALAEARQLLGVYRVQRDRAEAALAPPPAQDRGGELTKENF